MKNIALIALLLLCSTCLNAAKYYFSSSTGDDTRSITQAGSSATPWRSLSKLQSTIATLKPGDSVFFRRGDTWVGTFNVTVSGSTTARIYFGAYGSGALPIFTGAQTFSSWGAATNNVYTSSDALVARAGLNPRIAAIDDTVRQIGRWPNTGWLYSNDVGVYLTTGTYRNNRKNNITTIYDDKWPTYTAKPKSNFDNVDVVYRNTRWTTDYQRVSAGGKWDSTSVRFNSYSAKVSDAHCFSGFGYYFQNDAAFLDRPYEWYYDTVTRKMKVYLPSAPSNYKIQMPIYDTIVKSTNASFITFENLQIEMSNTYGLYVNNGTDVTVKNIAVRNVSAQGIEVLSCDNIIIDHVTVDGAQGYGIYVRAGSTNQQVRYNTVSNTMQYYGMQPNQGTTGTAIRVSANGNVHHNYAFRSGGNGIVPSDANNLNTYRNRVNFASLLLDDNGGIYYGNLTYKDTANQPGFDYKQYSGIVVKNNIVENVIGKGEGTLGGATASNDGRGIYLDLGVNHTLLDSNSVINCNVAFFNNDPHFNTWTNNVTYGINGRQSAIWIDERKQLYEVHDLVISGNTFFSTTTAKMLDFHQALGSSTREIQTWGKIDRNYYFNPTTATGEFRIVDGSAYSKSNNTLTQWRADYKMYDSNSVSSPIVNSNAVMKIVTNYTDDWQNISLNGRRMQDVKNKSYNGFINVPPYYSIPLIDIGAATATNILPQVSLTSPTDSSTFTALANVPLAATATDKDGKVTKVEFYSGTSLLFTKTTAPYTQTWTGVNTGNYNITAKVYDDSGAVVTSPIARIFVLNAQPSVSITSPQNNDNFTSPATIQLTANATDPNGTIKKVEFYNGLTKIFTDSTYPFNQVWSPVSQGNYSLTAKAYDNDGATVTSSAINISVANSLPQVALTSPANDAILTAPATINISADAFDANGTITKVEFYNGTTLLYTATAAPYAYTLANVGEGTYNISAKAYDNEGASTTTAAATVFVNPVVDIPNVAPTINLTSPANNTSLVAPATINLAATAADADGSVKKVEFYDQGVLIATDTTAPYTFAYTNKTSGQYVLSAQAVDDKGAIGNSQLVTVNVTNAPPTINFTSPANNATFNFPATVNFLATAQDADGQVVKVEFYNGNTLIATALNAPYTYTWNNAPAGSYALTAKAYDNEGAVTTSGVNTIIVNPPPPNQLPSVSLTSPANNATFTEPATVTLSATATDNDGSIVKVEFYNGDKLLYALTVAPYNLVLTGLPAGDYLITAKAYDNDGGATISTARKFTVNSIPNQPPTVTITSPTDVTTFTSPATITLNSDAEDLDGQVTKVDYYDGATLLFSTTSPFTQTWTGAAVGQHIITAKATDDDGATATSTPVTVTVNAPAPPPNVAPDVALTAPDSTVTYFAPATIFISAKAIDKDGFVTKVEFYNGATLIGTVNAPPFELAWTGVGVGTYTITAKAYDNSGAVATSGAVTVKVIAQPVTPPPPVTPPVTPPDPNPADPNIKVKIKLRPKLI